MEKVSRCDGCDRVMWREGEVKPPGAVRFAGKGMCASCRTRVRLRVPLPGNDFKCAKCGTWVDTSYGKAGVKPSSNGLCARCGSSAAAKDTPVRATYAGEMCAGGCGFELFSSNQQPVKGKRRHLKQGMCYPCYRRAMNAPLDEAQALALVPELSAMMRARKARQEKQARVEKARAVEYARYLHYKKTRTPA